MAVLPIVTFPDSRLKTKSSPVAEVTDETRAVMDNMLETMYASQGIGLAAVQIGVMERIIVMDINYGSERYEENANASPAQDGDPLFLINPEIVEISQEENLYQEGCLSFPGQYADVTRPKKITIKYLDYHGKEQKLEADELLATCVQHEIDHLDGITFIDHISKIKRDMVVRKMKKQRKIDQKELDKHVL